MDDFSEAVSPTTAFFTVSRWYSPSDSNETGRLVSLAAATLFKLGVTEPRRHVFLAASGSIATLIVSRSPFSDTSLALLDRVAADKQFKILLCPDRDPTTFDARPNNWQRQRAGIAAINRQPAARLDSPDRRTAVLLQSAAAV
jgi:hypothetical protein